MSESNDRPRDWLDTELDETLEEMFELEFNEPMMDDDIRRAVAHVLVDHSVAGIVQCLNSR